MQRRIAVPQDTQQTSSTAALLQLIVCRVLAQQLPTKAGTLRLSFSALTRRITTPAQSEDSPPCHCAVPPLAELQQALERPAWQEATKLVQSPALARASQADVMQCPSSVSPQCQSLACMPSRCSIRLLAPASAKTPLQTSSIGPLEHTTSI